MSRVRERNHTLHSIQHSALSLPLTLTLSLSLISPPTANRKPLSLRFR